MAINYMSITFPIQYPLFHRSPSAPPSIHTRSFPPPQKDPSEISGRPFSLKQCCCCPLIRNGVVRLSRKATNNIVFICTFPWQNKVKIAVDTTPCPGIVLYHPYRRAAAHFSSNSPPMNVTVTLEPSGWCFYGSFSLKAASLFILFICSHSSLFGLSVVVRLRAFCRWQRDALIFYWVVGRAV